MHYSQFFAAACSLKKILRDQWLTVQNQDSLFFVRGHDVKVNQTLSRDLRIPLLLLYVYQDGI